jgi:hypothetical protein
MRHPIEAVIVTAMLRRSRAGERDAVPLSYLPPMEVVPYSVPLWSSMVTLMPAGGSEG